MQAILARPLLAKRRKTPRGRLIARVLGILAAEFLRGMIGGALR